MKTKPGATHTPTPWRIWKGNSTKYGLLHDASLTIIGKDETSPSGVYGIAQLVAPNESDFLTQTANAEFIVRAVNSHEALLEAAKLALQCLVGREVTKNTLELTAKALNLAIIEAELA